LPENDDVAIEVDQQQPAWRTLVGSTIPNITVAAFTIFGFIYVLATPFIGRPFWISLFWWFLGVVVLVVIASLLFPIDKVGKRRADGNAAQKAKEKTEQGAKAIELREDSRMTEPRKDLMEGETIKGHSYIPQGRMVVKNGTPVASTGPLLADSICCPKCGSTQIHASKKGFGLGKAAVGGVLLGPVGLLGGFFGSNKVELVCLKCGKQWKPGN
jgi:tellurium resistance protein TerD